MSSMYIWQHQSMGSNPEPVPAQGPSSLSSASSMSTVTPPLSSPEDPQLVGFSPQVTSFS